MGSHEAESRPKVDLKLTLVELVQKSAVHIEKKRRSKVDSISSMFEIKSTFGRFFKVLKRKPDFVIQID